MDLEAYEAARTGIVRRDMSHFGRYRVWGKDAANLLHHLTTQDINSMRPGEVREAALVTSKARVLDWLTILRRHTSDFWVITSPNRKQSFKTHAPALRLVSPGRHHRRRFGRRPFVGFVWPARRRSRRPALADANACRAAAFLSFDPSDGAH